MGDQCVRVWLTQAGCSRVCLARHTDDAATSDGRYFRKGSEFMRASSQRYCRRTLITYCCIV